MAKKVDPTANESIQQTADIKFLLCCIESVEDKPNMGYVADRLGINKDAARKRWERLLARLKGEVKEEYKPRKPRTKKSEMFVRDGSEADLPGPDSTKKRKSTAKSESQSKEEEDSDEHDSDYLPAPAKKMAKTKHVLSEDEEAPLVDGANEVPIRKKSSSSADAMEHSPWAHVNCNRKTNKRRNKFVLSDDDEAVSIKSDSE